MDNTVIIWNILFVIGWSFTAILFIFEMQRWYRYRRIIKITMDVEDVINKEKTRITKYLSITMKNDGRRPANIIGSGFLYSDGEVYHFEQPYIQQTQSVHVASQDTPNIKLVYPTFWLYKTQPRVLNYSFTELKRIEKNYGRSINRVFLVEETGKAHIENIPTNVREELNEMTING